MMNQLSVNCSSGDPSDVGNIVLRLNGAVVVDRANSTVSDIAMFKIPLSEDDTDSSIQCTLGQLGSNPYIIPAAG